MLQLLRRGIPWDTLITLSENEINLIIGIDAAIEQKQADEAARESAVSLPTI